MSDKAIREFALGRLPSTDERDKNFLIKKVSVPPTLMSRYWNDSGWRGNQKSDPFCVGYSWAHWIEDGPVTHSGVAPIINPDTIYHEAQKIDEWEGINYDGTSVRAGAKYLQSIGVLAEYNWAFDLNTVINTILSTGPVVVGTSWTEEMFYPNAKGLIKIGGDIAGGHAYVLNGVNKKTKLLRIKNSWGTDWGINGRAFISFDDMRKLIEDQNGEACLGIENKILNPIN